jgi:hypothetical protein
MDLGIDSNKKGRSYVKWTNAMDKAMLDVYVDHYKKRRPCSKWMETTCLPDAVKKAGEKCEYKLTKENIISRRKTFDKHCVIINKMLCQSEFGSDSESNMIKVDSEDVWNNYATVNHTSYTTCSIDVFSCTLVI